MWAHTACPVWLCPCGGPLDRRLSFCGQRPKRGRHVLALDTQHGLALRIWNRFCPSEVEKGENRGDDAQALHSQKEGPSPLPLGERRHTTWKKEKPPHMKPKGTPPRHAGNRPREHTEEAAAAKRGPPLLVSKAATPEARPRAASSSKVSRHSPKAPWDALVQQAKGTDAKWSPPSHRAVKTWQTPPRVTWTL